MTRIKFEILPKIRTFIFSILQLKLFYLAVSIILFLFIFTTSTLSQNNTKKSKTVFVYSSNSFTSTPESFQYDSTQKYYFISNINGNPAGKDNNGYISKLDKNFHIVDKYFIKGGKNFTLNAPKGISIYKNFLAVTDIDAIKFFNTTNGKLLKIVSLKKKGAMFLNDCSFDSNGNLFVSDTSSNLVFLITNNGIIIKLIKLTSPNGVLVINNFLYVVTWKNARIYKIDLTTIKKYLKNTSLIKQDNISHLTYLVSLNIDELTKNLNVKLMNLDGIDYIDNNNIIFSDFSAGKVYIFNLSSHKIKTLLSNLNSPADISFNKTMNYILIPQFNDGIIVFHLN